jgi:glutamyl-tRNA reductase
MSLVAIGMNHKTASLDIREKFSLDKDESHKILKKLHSMPIIEEVFLLSTCNRTEIYCEIGDLRYVKNISRWLLKQKGLSVREFEEYIYSYSDSSVVKHALSVASGLDSMVIGESQILSQLKNAFNQASHAETIGKNLDRLFQYAFSTAKEVRTDTKIGASSLSIANVAVSLTDQFYDDLSDKNALLIGAGETIYIAAKNLRKKNIKSIFIANRTLEKAEMIAKEVSGTAISLKDIPRHLKDSDIIISAVSGNVPLVGKGAVETALKYRKHKPIYMVDLGVPRNIEAEVRDLPDIFLYTIDNIQELVRKNYNTRKEAAFDAQSIIDVRVQEYMNWRNSQSAFSVIKLYRDDCESIRLQCLEKSLSHLKSGKDPESIMEQLSLNITSKLSHKPTLALNKAGQTDNRKLINLICDIFLINKRK